MMSFRQVKAAQHRLTTIATLTIQPASTAGLAVRLRLGRSNV